MEKCQDFRNLIYSLVLFGRIETTKSKAKSIEGLVDKIINKIKKGTLAGKREVLAILPRKKVWEKLVKEIIPKLSKRKSGYTRILKIDERKGDRAPMVIMEWVFDKEEPKETSKISKNKNIQDKKKEHVKTNTTD